MTFKTFIRPDGLHKWKVYNGPMVLRTGLCRTRKEAIEVARAYISSGQAQRKAMSFGACLEFI